MQGKVVAYGKHFWRVATVFSASGTTRACVSRRVTKTPVTGSKGPMTTLSRQKIKPYPDIPAGVVVNDG